MSERLHKSYQDALNHIPKLMLASCGFTLTAAGYGFVIQKIHGHESGFDAAVNLLVHYPQAVSGILAFFNTAMFFLFVTFVLEPSVVGGLFRKWIVVPSMHIAEHMLAMATGVWVAWAVMEVNTIMESDIIKTIVDLTAALSILGLLAVFCSLTAVFIEEDMHRVLPRLGKYKYAVILLVSCVFIVSVYTDTVINFKVQMH